MTSPPPYGAPQQHPWGPPQQPWGGQYTGYPPPPRPTNNMAVAALIGSLLFAPLGIIFGHISLSQIKRSGEDGHGLAIAGLVIGYLMTIVSIIAIVAMVLFLYLAGRTLDGFATLFTPRNPYPSGTTAYPASLDNPLPAFKPPANLGANCSYPATIEPASKPATPPRSGKVPTTPAEVSASVSTTAGGIGLRLDNAKSPCTVNNFASLAQQGYFDGTSCHRLTTKDTLSVLQCGDPTGQGTGGPGYRFANEYPTNQYPLADAALQQAVIYPRGTLAMANTGPGTNGSQFFMVYKDSHLPPTYTVFGTIDDTGLAALDKVAAAGVADGSADGKPADAVEITSARLD
jgi:peptidyl-prolyl cis-trans isomerase B (cyclophilin B)